MWTCFGCDNIEQKMPHTKCPECGLHVSICDKESLLRSNKERAEIKKLFTDEDFEKMKVRKK